MNKFYILLILSIFLFSCNNNFENKLKILYSANTNGTVFHCGCPNKLLGGLAKRATVIKKERGGNIPTLLLEAGDLLSSPINKAVNSVCLKTVQTLNYDALNIGEQDIIDERIFDYNLPYISANIKRIGPSKPLTPYITKKINNIDVTIIGITDKESFTNLPPNKQNIWEIKDPIITLKELLPNIKNSLIILLAHVSYGVEDIIAYQYNDIDIIISSHGYRPYTNPIKKINNTLIMHTDIQGKRLGYLEIELKDKNIINFKHKLIEIEQSIADDSEINDIINLYNIPKSN